MVEVSAVELSVERDNSARRRFLFIAPSVLDDLLSPDTGERAIESIASSRIAPRSKFGSSIVVICGVDCDSSCC